MITIILPILNERNGLEWWHEKAKEYPWYKLCQVIVADCKDGSTDGSIEYCKLHPKWQYVRQRGVGMADAVNEAYKLAQYDRIFVVSPDGNADPEAVEPMMREMSRGADIVATTRYSGWAKSYDDDVVTAFGNWMFTKLVNMLFFTKHTDVLNGYKLYSRRAIEVLGLNKPTMLGRINGADDWGLCALCRAKRYGISIVELPSSEGARVGGERKMKIIRNGVMCMIQIAYERIRR